MASRPEEPLRGLHGSRNHIGHAKRGNATYAPDAEGNHIVREVDGGEPGTTRLEEVVDDDTLEIAIVVRQWPRERD